MANRPQVVWQERMIALNHCRFDPGPVFVHNFASRSGRPITSARRYGFGRNTDPATI